MEKLSMCRICLVKNVRMFNLVNTNLQETYKNLTGIQFQTKDLRPSQVCYICYARLQTCHKLRANSLVSEEFFTGMLYNNTFQPPPTFGSFTKHVVAHLSVAPQDNSDAEDNKVDPLKLKNEVQVKIENVEDAEDVFDSKDLNAETEDHKNAFPPIKVADYTSCNTSEYSCNSTLDIKQEYKFENTEVKSQPLTTDDNIDHSTHSPDLIENMRLKNTIVLRGIELPDIKTSVPAPTTLKAAEPVGNTQGNHILYNSIRKYYNKKVAQLKQVDMNNSAKLNKCDKCGECFDRKGDLTKHKLVHSTENSYKCDICGKCFTKRPNLRSHVRTHTANKPHKCKICGKCFLTEYMLSKHAQIHINVKSYECDTCGKCFLVRRRIIQHLLAHTGVTSHKCKTCGKYFTSKFSLTSHILTHTGEKPHKCDICGNCFTLKKNLRLHKFTHTAEKPHKCYTCGNSFTTKGMLTDHIHVRHMNIKPYKCNICGKCFTSRGSLRSHNRIHTGEKFKCNTCEKSYIAKKNLKAHILTHTGGKPLN